ncbi:MAG: methyltransferase domain-containing protein [bacterium]|nr:methyltransferase domain-containing protein [bacterium]
MEYQKRLLDLIEQYTNTGKMLEIGVGAGLFMQLANERGWNIEGIDPSEGLCRHVSKKLQRPIHHGFLGAGLFPEQSFDAIVLRHVLEHISTPMAFVRELHRILKNDGVIGLAVPNFGGLHSRIEKAKWYHLNLPYHRAHYTPKTLSNMLAFGGFEIISFQTMDLSCSSYLIQLANIFLKLLRQKPFSIYVIPYELEPSRGPAHWVISKEAIFNRFMARFGLGEELVAAVRKKQ